MPESGQLYALTQLPPRIGSFPFPSPSTPGGPGHALLTPPLKVRVLDSHEHLVFLLPSPVSLSLGPPRRSDYRVKIKNLPSTASWQDIKSYFRKVAEPGFVEVSRGEG